MSLELALEWAAKGYPVGPADPNTKAPWMGKNWEKQATTDPEQIRAWAFKWSAGAKVGIKTGLACGCGCQDGPDVLDFDVSEGKPGIEQRRALVEAGVLDRYKSMRVKTPSGGEHWWFAGSAQHNKQNDDSVWGVDLRAHHGWIIAPGNPGYATIGEIPDELGPSPLWAVVAAAPGIVQKTRPAPPPTNRTARPGPTPPPAPPVSPRGQETANRRSRLVAPLRDFGDQIGEESPLDWYGRQYDLESLLLQNGWSYAYEHQEKRYFTRPGKDAREGVSGNIATMSDGRQVFYSFSSSVDIPSDRALSPGMLYAWLNHGGDLRAAANTIRHTMMPQRAPAPAPMAPPPPLEQPRARLVAPLGTDTPPASPRPTGGTPGAELELRQGTLPHEFYDGCPELEHIKREAHKKGRSATTATMGVLALIASMADKRLRIPSYVGTDSSLSLYVCAVAPPGGGKSSGVGVARRLVSWEESRPEGGQSDYISNSPSTGPGMLEVHFSVMPDPENPKRVIKEQTVHNVFWSFDEGQTLIARLNDKGSTLGYTLRTGWTGGEQGQANANVEYRRQLPALSYQWGFMVVIQDAFVGELLNETDGGTAQRFIWCSTEDPEIPDWKDRDWQDKTVRSLCWVHPAVPAPRFASPEGIEPPHYIEFPRDFLEEMMTWDDNKRKHPGRVDVIDNHLYLSMMKAAANLALLRGRLVVDEDDIRRVRMLFDSVSRPVSRRLASRIRHEEAKREVEVAEKRVRIEQSAEDAREKKVAEIVARKVREAGADGLIWGKLTPHIARYRKALGEERTMAIIAEMEAAGTIRRLRTTPEGNPVYHAE